MIFDFIIVGQGIAGSSFAFNLSILVTILFIRKKSFINSINFWFAIVVKKIKQRAKKEKQ